MLEVSFDLNDYYLHIRTKRLSGYFKGQILELSAVFPITSMCKRTQRIRVLSLFLLRLTKKEQLCFGVC